MFTNVLLLRSGSEVNSDEESVFSHDDHDDDLDNSAGSSECLDELASPVLTKLPNKITTSSGQIITVTFSAQSFKKTLEALSIAGLPFCLSRLAVSVQGIGYAYLMGQFGNAAISAGPLISGLQNALVTPLRTGLAAMGVIVPGIQEPRQIGRLVRQAYASTILLTIPTAAMLLNAGVMLRAMGTDPSVADKVQHYMVGYTWGVLPLYGLVIDQQFSLAIGKRHVATLIGLAYASLILVSGYLLTTQIQGSLYHSTYGLGLGISVSAWLVNLSTKLFFLLHKDYQAYHLFHVNDFFEELPSNIKKMLSIAMPMALQSLSESFNLMVISILMSRISNEALMAEQVSLQWMTAFSPIILAIANVTCSMCSRLYNMLLRSAQQQQPGVVKQILTQLKKQTMASMLIASGIGIIFAGLFLSIPKALTYLFVPVSNDSLQEQTVVSLSTDMLRTNSAGVLFDSLRLVLTGNLLGMRDAIVPAAVSFLLISGLGLLIGAVATELFHFSSNSLFIIRNAFIAIAALTIIARWFVYRDDLKANTEALSMSVHVPEVRHVISVNHSDANIVLDYDLQGHDAVSVSSSDVPQSAELITYQARKDGGEDMGVELRLSSGLTQYGSFFRDSSAAPDVRIETKPWCHIC